MLEIRRSILTLRNILLIVVQGIARALTIPLVACSVCIFGIAYWQMRVQGGLGWLFGRNDKIIAAYKPKGDYIGLKG